MRHITESHYCLFYGKETVEICENKEVTEKQVLRVYSCACDLFWQRAALVPE